MVHGDDFLSEGQADRLMMMNLAREKSFRVKTEVIDPDPGQQREGRNFNGVVRWEDSAITREPTQQQRGIVALHTVEFRW